ncbi:hypothetical protein CKAH01_02228 [Colletotrichum kahawae]|uniref:Uncharacterized protein n=1 Tax=Colletotrichum kahawae TaxID=34407 RepID=A0AAD9Y3W3_COLKA|nr:hypothetical protein CKAH01_02228 [Colletotrichum kahawae]
MTSQRSPSHFSFPKPAVCPPTGSTALARMGRVVQVALFAAGPHPKKTPWSRPTGGRRSRDPSSRTYGVRTTHTHTHTKSTALGQELPPLVLFFPSLFSDLSPPLPLSVHIPSVKQGTEQHGRPSSQNFTCHGLPNQPAHGRARFSFYP